MVIREWRGRADPARGDAYPAHFRDNVLPGLHGLSGFVGAHLARRELGGRLEFVVLTRWRSLDAIRAFAGADIGKAVVEPRAIAALIDFDTRVQHYEVLESVDAD